MNEELDFIPEGNRGSGVMREVYDWTESVVTALISVVLIFVFIGLVIRVDGESMLPTLQDSERLICLKLGELRYGDVVVVTKPGLKNNPLIKRVIATSGQTIDFDFDSGVVFVDGKELKEPYTYTPTNWHVEGVDYPLTVPEGHVFVMGDNRNNSWDSRVPEVGMVDRRYIMGRAVYRVAPYSRMGRVKL